MLDIMGDASTQVMLGSLAQVWNITNPLQKMRPAPRVRVQARLRQSVQVEVHEKEWKRSDKEGRAAG